MVNLNKHTKTKSKPKLTHKFKNYSLGHIIMHNCRTQHSTPKFWLLSILTSIQLSKLRWCLLGRRKKLVKQRDCVLEAVVNCCTHVCKVQHTGRHRTLYWMVNKRPQLVGAAAAAVSHAEPAPVQCDDDCAAAQSAAEANRLPASVSPPVDPSHVTALLALPTQCQHARYKQQYTCPTIIHAGHWSLYMHQAERNRTNTVPYKYH